MRGVISKLAATDGEDLLMGYVTHQCPMTEAASWGVSVSHDLDHGPGLDQQAYFGLEQACLAWLNVTAPWQLVTGSCSKWGIPETLGPMSAAVHRVGGASQWRRAVTLAHHWSEQLAKLDHPACFFPFHIIAPTSHQH